MAENYCKAHPAVSFQDLRKTAEYAFNTHVTEATWRGVRRSVVKWEDHYLSAIGGDVGISDEEAIDKGDVDGGENGAGSGDESD